MSRVRPVFSRRFLLLAAVLLLLLHAISYASTESQWFAAVGYADVWHIRCLAQLQIAVISFVLMGGFMLGAVHAAARDPLKTVALPKGYHGFEQWLARARRLTLRLAWAGALLLPLYLAKTLCAFWPEWLLLLNGRSTAPGMPWAAFTNAFSLYCLPFLRPFVGALWTVALATLTLVAAIQAPAAFYRLLSRGQAANAPSCYLTALTLAVLFVVRSFGYRLQRFEAGVGMTDAMALKKSLLLGGEMTCALAALAVVGFCLVVYRQGARVFPAWTWRRFCMAAGASMLVHSGPSVAAGTVSTPLVHPLPKRDGSLSEWQLAPLNAWGLGDLGEYRDIQARSELQAGPPQIPIWSRRELPRARGGFALSPPQALVRRSAAGPSLLAACVPEPQAEATSSWPLRHLARLASRPAENAIVAYEVARADGGRPVQTRIAPPSTADRVVYGSTEQPWLLTDEAVPGAIDISAWWRRALWAVRLRDTNLLLAGGAYRSLIWRRSVGERLTAIAPFLEPGGEPYIVPNDAKPAWMSDALSVSSGFPGGVAAPGEALRGFNAAFDSVKMVMDPGEGSFTFYAARPNDSRDPLLRVWKLAFPGLIRPLAEMPAELRARRRYPPLLFQVQAELLAGWRNQQMPVQRESFEEQSSSPRTLSPSYALMANGRFVLETAFVSADGQTIEDHLLADCDGEYGRVTIWRDDQEGASPLAFTSGLTAQVMSDSGEGGGPEMRLAADESWEFGDVSAPAGRSGELWLPIFAVSNTQSRLAAVMVQRGRHRGIGASREEAWFDLLQKYTVPAAGSEPAAQELAAKAAKLQRQAENAVRRGAMTEWSRLMAAQRETLLRLQGKLQAPKPK